MQDTQKELPVFRKNHLRSCRVSNRAGKHAAPKLTPLHCCRVLAPSPAVRLSDVTRGILQNRGPCREALHNAAVRCPSLKKNLAFFSVVSYSLPTVPTGLFPDIYPKTFSYFHSRFFQYPDTDTSQELLDDHSAAVLFLWYK